LKRSSLDADHELIRQESLFGRLPLLPSEREYGTLGAHNTCFAYAVATWCFLTGAYVAQFVGAIQGVACLIAGSLIGIFLTTMPVTLGCHRYGLEQIDFCKPAFGQRGSRLVLVFFLITMLGWNGFILVMFGNGIRNIIQALGYTPASWVVGAGVAFGLATSYTTVTRGVHWLNVSNSIITPGLSALIVFMIYMLVSEHGWQEIAAAEPLNPFPNPFVNYMVAVEIGIAGGVGWWGGLGFLARNTLKRRNAVYPVILHMGFSQAIVCSVSLFSALIVQTEDPTEWMVPLGGPVMGVLAICFVALANVTSSSVSMFASGLALRHIKRFRLLPWSQLMLLTILPCLPFVIWPNELYSLGDAFLTYNGTLFAPVTGILFTDYFLLRGQSLNLRAIFSDGEDAEYHYQRGYNWVALGCVVLGQLVYLALYNPLTSETSEMFRFLPASIASFAVPAVTYGIAAGLLRHRAKSRGCAQPTEAAADAQASARGRGIVDPNI
jgi:NCS1 family nucleobase:cation symporter-1